MPNVRYRLPRVLALCVLIGGSALTSCASDVVGRPIPAAGFQEHPEAPQTRSAIATPPRIPAPRGEVGPCTLLSPADLGQVGGVAGPPHPGNPVPGACAHLLGGQPDNTAAAGFHEPYPAIAQRQPRGVEVDVHGYSSWLYCEPVTGYQTCTAATAIRSDRSLLTMLSLKDASAADTADRLFGLTTAALQKLPPA
ncbi:DUF3558 domain-containing protein [Saccharopolyspora mangrovi]|uniref:DUF3558 domain-containing protein n=1 Tax=Saccharopolyspora mangrovi TaxID=3082379 RepID=A0ABU6A8W8_9PSEU|nr:DUF3558 domain-containing protein [Saccharopolyspora sp. S2-29]MEB3368018.1 DUF3558 domain-containing protein [Saccharopolyspora sp. S2-29]